MKKQQSRDMDFDALCFIVDDGIGSQVLHVAMEDGCSGGTIFYGTGTINDVILELFGLEESHKEIVIMTIERSLSSSLMSLLVKKFKLNKSNYGIAFKMPIITIVGTNKSNLNAETKFREEHKNMYQGIVTIVKQGFAEEVIKAAETAGSKGGTIISGRGASNNETIKLFSVEVEPEKDIVLILSAEKQTKRLVEAINSTLEIDKPGNGVLFTVNLSETHGLF